MKEKTLKSYKDLLIWNSAIEISVEVYRLTMGFPATEVYGLTNQIRRAANSISLNIAEGYSRTSNKSYVHSLSIAYGSLLELESAIYLAEKLKFIQSFELELLNQMLTEECKMLYSLMKKIQEKII